MAHRLACALVTVAAALVAGARTFTWTGRSGADAGWADGGNWDRDGAVPAAAVSPRSAHAGEKAMLRFGLLSDTHISLTNSTATLLKQLGYLSEQGVRLVLVTGDVVDLGLLSELRRFRSVWDAAFPDGKNAQGESCRLFVCWGNHDYHDQAWFESNGYGAAEWQEAILNGNQDAAWRILMDEDFPGELSVLKLNDVTFVTAHWGHFGDDLAPFLSAHAAEIPTDRPVFFLQHSHPNLTCYGNWYAKTNAGANAVAVAGFGDSYKTDGAFIRYIVRQVLPGGAKGFGLMINGSNLQPGFEGLFMCVNQSETVCPHD